MNPLVNLTFDVLLIVFVSIGIVQAMRLIRHLANLQQGRLEMQRFVQEFNTTVMRAEAGIKNLRQAARDSGDDLEKLVAKAVLVRDELSFIVESADQIADRLSENASSIIRSPEGETAKPAQPKSVPVPVSSQTPPPVQGEKIAFFIKKSVEHPSAAATSRAERELLQALEKLG
jgi:hypothetical protein